MTTLKNRRIECKITQQEVAQRAGISVRQYIRIENGERLPNVVIAYKIAHCLNSTIETCFYEYLTRN